jgi:hypothetical protein
MRVQVWDSGFVRATRAQVHLVLRDPAGYGCWWPGVSARADGRGVALDVAGAPWRGGGHRLDVRVARDRPAKGLTLRCEGVLRGEAEWYYEAGRGGVVVHYLLRAEAPERRGPRIVRAHRWRVRGALLALKDGLEGGRPPGAD